MNILITNDDGYQAKGIQTLIRLMLPLGHVTVVAPDGPRSGQSSAISVGVPLRMKKISPKDLKDLKDLNEEGLVIYACTGTPADCVKMALHTIFKDKKPDLIVSGINHGSNAAVNVIYSGTMGACLVAVENGIPAVGYSICNHSADADFATFGKYIPQIALDALKANLPYGVCWNVNAPKDEIQGIRFTRQCKGHWHKEYIEYADPLGNPFYMLTGEFLNHEPDAEDTDEWALAHGYISITPTTVDMTYYGQRRMTNNE